jgi:hypothetical protein
MPTNSTGLLQRPQVYRSPVESMGYTTTIPRGAGGIPPRALAGLGETDFYLRRSYVIVERLRRAVADRESEPLSALL